VSTPRAHDAAVEAARAAGALALRYYRGGFEVMTKPDQTPVTLADQEAERTIVEMLGAAFPDHGFLGEEFGAQGPQERRWIIDPIDGTRNFVRHVPIWAVLIALEEAGEVTAGAIYNPVVDEMYSAHRGGGAYLNGERIHVSAIRELAEATFLHAGLGIVRKAGWWAGFERLIDGTRSQRGPGDYLGYALVASGRGEIYAELDLKPWDLAPCKIVVEEAGGRFTDFEGRPTIYSGTAVVTNGHLHDATLAALRRS
jgi:histidinol phosphatase-like enzyme (inositol monophosphatase family)